MSDLTKPTPEPLPLADLRQDYRLAALDESVCHPNPIVQFQRWFQEARASQLTEPNAMILATVNVAGQPSARVVLLKGVEDDHFLFFTNYESRKGRDLLTNPNCALTFYWAELERQVRIDGVAEKVAAQKSEDYFRNRPKGSRLGALASKQSEPLTSRQILETRLQELEAKYAHTDDVPKPEHWGGYRVAPHLFEFWQGRSNRLHDRVTYQLDAQRVWRMGRLSP